MNEVKIMLLNVNAGKIIFLLCACNQKYKGITDTAQMMKFVSFKVAYEIMEKPASSHTLTTHNG
jgi:hypothetical protein